VKKKKKSSNTTLPQDIKFNRYQRKSLKAQTNRDGTLSLPGPASAELREEGNGNGHAGNEGQGRREVAGGASGRNGGDGGV
jgi:hypothetical protein